MPSSAIGSVLESMPGSVLENVLGGVLGSVLGVYFRAYLGACNDVHFVESKRGRMKKLDCLSIQREGKLWTYI